MRPRPATLLLLLALVPGAGACGARAALGAAPGDRPIALRVVTSPSTVRIGEVVAYRAFISGAGRGSVRVLAPPAGGDLDWGEVRVRGRGPRGEPVRPDRYGRFPTSGQQETLAVEVPLRVFRTGVVSIPGLRFEIDDGRGATEHRLPTARVYVAPVIPPEDTAATLRPPRGPYAAPWWERVPWRIAVAAALALVAAILLIRRLRRRRAQEVPAPVVAARDPAREALEALEALRGLHLPEHGRFAEHAFHLTRILRRFLEATETTPRPGDTTPELLDHLQVARLAPADLERLAALLAIWDRVKFARAATTPEEARRAEDVVEELARRRAPDSGREAA